MFLDRGFAYLHIPGTPIFVGEVVLAIILWFLVFRASGLRIADSLPGAVFLLFLIFNLVRMFPSIGQYGLDAFRDSSIWYYSITAFVTLGLVKSGGLEAAHSWYRRLLPVFFAWAPLSIVLSQVADRPYVPDSEVRVFSHKGPNTALFLCAGIVYLWTMAADERRGFASRRVLFTAFAAMAIALLGIQNRGGFVASTAMLVTAAFLARTRGQRRFGMIMFGTVVAAVALFSVLDLRFSVFNNNREISAEQLAANLLSVVDRDVQTRTEDLAGNTTWRLNLWEAVLRDINTLSPATGFGYGPNIAKEYGFAGDEDNFRSAHNSHVTLLARSGWIGVGLWGLLWWSWFDQVLKSRRRFLAMGRLFHADVCSWLVAFAVGILVNAIFDPTIESPQVAAWAWSLFGLGLGMISIRNESPANVGHEDTKTAAIRPSGEPIGGAVVRSRAIRPH